MKSLQTLVRNLASPAYIRDYRPVPFWSWNDKLDKSRLCKQIEWMHENGIGGFFMHARSGLITEYLGEDWMQCCDACCDKAQSLDMDAYMYDENGWPSGFAGGKLLTDENNRDRYVTYNTGDYDPNALVSYKITPRKLIRTACAQKGERYLNVYQHISVSTADILNPAVVEKFLDLTHRAYKKRYGAQFAQKIKGFFTDEPQYFRWDTSYTPMIADYFKNVYHEDVLDGIGLLFAEKEGYEVFRYKYWTGMRALFLQNFAKKLYDFCEENNMVLTGHYVEESAVGYQVACCGGAMPFYAYEHIPGIDWLGRGLPGELAVKQVGSAAAQTGKNRVLTESFGCCGWDVTPRELKKILDYQYLGGVNLLCHHLMPSSEYGQRKRDYPSHYTPLNPWTEYGFKDFNVYYTRLGALIGNSTETVNTCILHPVTSAYIDYKRNEDYFGVYELEKSFHDEAEMLGRMHIPHHYADEVLLERMGSVQNGRLVCGKCAYRYVILPSIKNISASTYKLLVAFVKEGGKLLLLGNAPYLLDGNRHTFDDLRSNCTLEEIRAAQPYGVDNPDLRSSMRAYENTPFVYVINPTDEAQTFTLAAKDATAVRTLDLETLTVSAPLPLTHTLRGGQSVLLFPVTETARPQKVKPVIKLTGSQKVTAASYNTLMLDAARYAKEGEDFGENMPLIQIFARLLDERYKGVLRLKYEFESKTKPATLRLLAEDMNTLSVCINGHTVQKQGVLDNEPMVQIFDAAPFVQTGKNEIVVTLNYFQDDNVYYALFGEGVTEGIRNCMVYNTSLESVYLYGDFGVFPVNLRKGQSARTVVCDDFILDEKKTQVQDFVRDGYGTFAGEITLESEINCPADGCLLEIGGRWQTAIIECNGKQKKLLFDSAADISDMVHAGKNTVRVTLVPSLRNLMGPHHFAPDDDPDAVGPETFTLLGSWRDGESPLLRKSYALVNLKF